MILLKNFLKKDGIGEPPWEYDFLYNLPESEYPKYLAKIFNYRTGEKLPLRFDFGKKAWVIDKNKCKTFNQKIQWLKLYDSTPLKRDCTDKIKVRDYVKEKIGEEYLKPVLQICDSFDEIDFDKLPNSYVIKCNHGCKWQYMIKNKKEFLNTKPIFELAKRNMIGWLEQEFWAWNGFELQYKGIEPKILIESLLRDEINKNSEEIQFYCFNEIPKFIVRLQDRYISLYDENLNIIDNVLIENDIQINKPVDDLLNQSLVLSKDLSENFSFVRGINV